VKKLFLLGGLFVFVLLMLYGCLSAKAWDKFWLMMVFDFAQQPLGSGFGGGNALKLPLTD
jgi:hypothetical protein